jgi:hypothetical protein
MNPHLTRALVTAYQTDLERQAGCCTPAAEHRREVPRSALRRRIAARRVPAPRVCCA